jgi:hypothetical protein
MNLLSRTITSGRVNGGNDDVAIGHRFFNTFRFRVRLPPMLSSSSSLPCSSLSSPSPSASFSSLVGFSSCLPSAFFASDLGRSLAAVVGRSRNGADIIGTTAIPVGAGPNDDVNDAIIVVNADRYTCVDGIMKCNSFIARTAGAPEGGDDVTAIVSVVGVGDVGGIIQPGDERNRNVA